MIDIDHPAIQVGVNALMGHHPERGGQERVQAVFAVINSVIEAGYLIKPPDKLLAIRVRLVRLNSLAGTNTEYHIHDGSIGYIKHTWPESASNWDDIRSAVVDWTEDPGPSGGSIVAIRDLEYLGHIDVEVPEDVQHMIALRAQLELPEWLVYTRARQMVMGMLDQLSEQTIPESGDGETDA